jgi:serine/threonine-protein kinase
MTNNNNFILSGRYELLSPLGRGQSGSVFLARQQSLEQNRAVKLIPKTNAPSLFAQSEAQILKSVRHPGIPTIYDFEEDESYYYLVEEYIQGESLEEFLLHQQSISQRLFFEFCAQLCDIFAYLHALRPAPILYQDLKPEHIIVCGLQIKLIDFGVASFFTGAGKDFNYFGNVDFSAPELASGEPFSPASDLYSIGRVMEYMLPYAAASTARNVYPIIQKATSAEPGLRYQTVGELSAALQAANDNTGSTHLRQTIAVLGTYPGCGCTHIAFSLVSALNFLGFHSVYQEENASNHLRCAMMQLDQVWERQGIYCCHCFQGYPKYDVGVSIPEPQADIIVKDYGCDYTSPGLAGADRILLVCGGALWHRDDARPEDFLFELYPGRLQLIANLCDRNSAIYFARKFSLPIYRYPYDPDLFRMNREKEDFVRWLSLEKGGKHIFSRFRNRFFRLLRR